MERKQPPHRSTPGLRLFRSFIKINADGSLEASGVISRECFTAWLDTRGAKPCNETSRKFYRTLTNHVAGTDGRSPFEEQEEQAILTVLRRRQAWPCYPAVDLQIGKRYHSLGYHEKCKHADGLCKKQNVDHRQDNVERMMLQLDPNDAVYLRKFSASIASERADLYTDKEIYGILRFMVLAKTARCAKENIAPRKAQAICNDYANREQVCIVLDLAAKSSQHSVLAQNQASHQVFQSFTSVIGLRIDLFRVLLAIGGAYHQPGVTFTVNQQELHCWRTSIRKFDMSYMVDVNSCVLVVHGCPSL